MQARLVTIRLMAENTAGPVPLEGGLWLTGAGVNENGEGARVPWERERTGTERTCGAIRQDYWTETAEHTENMELLTG